MIGKLAFLAGAAMMLTGVSTLSLPSSAAADDTCMRMEDGGSLGTWSVVNECDYEVIGDFCYYDDSPMSCDSGGGGFGPLDPGETEAVTPPESTTRYHLDWCPYDEWPGDCSFS